MSDLISRSSLIKEIEKYKFGAISNDTEREYIKNTILNFIICQPTVYDNDKEDERNKAIDDFLNTFETELRSNTHVIYVDNPDYICVTRGSVERVMREVAEQLRQI